MKNTIVKMFGDNETVENSGSNAKPGRVTNAEGNNNNLLRYGGLIATALFVVVGTACFFQGFGAGTQIVRKLAENGISAPWKQLSFGEEYGEKFKKCSQKDNPDQDICSDPDAFSECETYCRKKIETINFFKQLKNKLENEQNNIKTQRENLDCDIVTMKNEAENAENQLLQLNKDTGVIKAEEKLQNKEAKLELEYQTQKQAFETYFETYRKDQIKPEQTAVTEAKAEGQSEKVKATNRLQAAAENLKNLKVRLVELVVKQFGLKTKKMDTAINLVKNYNVNDEGLGLTLEPQSFKFNEFEINVYSGYQEFVFRDTAHKALRTLNSEFVVNDDDHKTIFFTLYGGNGLRTLQVEKEQDTGDETLTVFLTTNDGTEILKTITSRADGNASAATKNVIVDAFLQLHKVL